MTEDDSNRVNILSLNGGGVKGLFTISVLAEIERIIELETDASDVRIGDYFDLITGTSIGGILALGLAKGKSARELKSVFYESSHLIFPRWPLFDGFIKTLKKVFFATYSSAPLKNTIENMIGKEATFRDLKRRVMIPTVNLSTGEPVFFKTPHHPSFTRDIDVPLVDAALATSAAPTYFSPHYIESLSAYYADGGLVANNPSFIGLQEFFKDIQHDFPDTNYQDVHVLNVGTLDSAYAISPKILNSRLKKGYIGLWGLGERLVLSTMAANQSLHQNMLKRELYRVELQDNYISLDASVPNEAASTITLDNSSKSSLDYLASRGKQLVTKEYSNNLALQAFFKTKTKPFK